MSHFYYIEINAYSIPFCVFVCLNSLHFIQCAALQSANNHSWQSLFLFLLQEVVCDISYRAYRDNLEFYLFLSGRRHFASLSVETHFSIYAKCNVFRLFFVKLLITIVVYWSPWYGWVCGMCVCVRWVRCVLRLIRHFRERLRKIVTKVVDTIFMYEFVFLFLLSIIVL